MGNMSFVYNPVNHISEVAVNGQNVADYIYNWRNQRTIKDAGASTVIYHYCKDALLIAETTASGATQKEYIYLEGKPLAEIAGSDVYYVHTDHLGTPQAMTDSSRNIVWKGDYKPFGEVNEVVGAVDNNFRFPGQYYDAESGLYYNWNRYYLAGVGRYLTADPIGLDGGMGLYGYAEGNPVNKIDFKGLAAYIDSDISGPVVMGGTLTVYCCDSNGKRRMHLYLKICLGATYISGSTTSGPITNSDGTSCDNPPKKLLGVEGGGGFGGGNCGGGLTFDLGGSGTSLNYGCGTGGGIVPISFTVCYYQLTSSTQTDICCN
jgi:RHS repeat-associated protein